MNYKYLILSCISVATIASAACAKEKLMILNEGNWQSDSGKLSYFEDGRIVSNQWFRDVNGYKLGDTPNDIIEVKDGVIAIAVNWSNIVQFIDPNGKALGATEDVPNNRCLASDGNYVYVSSFGHECGTVDGAVDFEKGYVAKIDATTFKVLKAVEVGYEPEGIAYYDGHIFVANSGGYAAQEPHDYEQTISVIDAETMQVVRSIDTGQPNLAGTLSISGKYICVGSPGDYYEIPAATIILDCEAALDGKPDEECFVLLECGSSSNCVDAAGNFMAVGSRYSYISSDYSFDYVTINPEEVMTSGGDEGLYESFPGTMLEDITTKIAMPYGVYVNPYTGYIYASDAGSFASAGKLYQWTPEGELIGTYDVYINPGHFLAIDPDKDYSGVDEIVTLPEAGNADIYNLQGIKVAAPRKGEIYISGGKKVVY